jgi:serine/threonine-protein kinase RsbW
MHFEFGICLPRDETSVPVVRHLCRATLDRLGAEEDCAHDIEVALSEACTNVLRHVNSSQQEYEVKIQIDEQRCTVRIIDTGQGFTTVKAAASDLNAEGGRGIELMRYLVDDLNFSFRPEAGMVVELGKTLSLRSGSIIRLMGARSRAQATS